MHNSNRYRYIDSRRLLAVETILTIPRVAGVLLLIHVCLSHPDHARFGTGFLILAIACFTPARVLLYRRAATEPLPSSIQMDRERELQILRTVIDSLPDRIYVKDRQSKFILTNRSLRLFSTGSPHADIIGKDDLSFFPAPLAAKFFKDEQAIMDGGDPVSHSRWDKDVSGNQVWTLTTKVPFKDKNGSIIGLIGIGRDLSAQKRLEDSLLHAHEEMRYKATHDALTSLLNRGMILDLLERELRRTRREHGSTALLIADVDNFKMVNDTLGHMVGDEVLREVARRLTDSVRSYDFVGRYGGEEFLLVLSNCENCTPLERAEEIRKAICHTPIQSSHGDLHITISIGVLASSDWKSFSSEELVKRADAALYAAKAAGRNRCYIASSKPPSESASPSPMRSASCDHSCRTGARPEKLVTVAS